MNNACWSRPQNSIWLEVRCGNLRWKNKQLIKISQHFTVPSSFQLSWVRIDWKHFFLLVARLGRGIFSSVCKFLLEQAATYWSYYACLPMIKPNIAILGHVTKYRPWARATSHPVKMYLDLPKMYPKWGEWWTKRTIGILSYPEI